MDLRRIAIGIVRSKTTLSASIPRTAFQERPCAYLRPAAFDLAQRGLHTTTRRLAEDNSKNAPLNPSPSSLGWGIAGIGGNRPSSSTSTAPSTGFPSNTSSRQSSSPGIDLSRMMTPTSKSPMDTANLMRDLNLTMVPPVPEKPSLRLRPSIGRSVKVTKDNVPRGFTMLEALVARNRVRADQAMGKFYERGGTKRKRLKSQRWRKRFFAGFKATVARVKELQKQGW